MKRTNARSTEPQTPITIPTICPSESPIMPESVEVVISADAAVKPASTKAVLAANSVSTKVLRVSALVLACSMVSDVVAVTVLVDRFRREVVPSHPPKVVETAFKTYPLAAESSKVA